MYFRLSTALALLSAPFLVLAQSNGPNAFKVPSGGYSAQTGQATDLMWTPTTGGTVSLLLRSGSMNDLTDGVTIASHIPNDGSYSWTPAAGTPRGSQYTIEIVDDADPSQTNYTPYFVLESDTVTPSTTAGGVTSSGTMTSSTSLKTATGSTTEDMPPPTMASMSSGSMETGMPTGGMNTGTNTGMNTGMNTMSGMPSMSSGTASGAGFQGTSSSMSVPTDNSAPRATVMAGMLGAVALGAFAL